MSGVFCDRRATARVKGKIYKMVGRPAREARSRWLRHVWRRDAGYIARRVLKMELPGKKKRKRPKRRFMDVVREDVQVVGTGRDGSR